MTTVALTLVPDADDQRMFLPFVSVEVDGVPLKALLDSGASRTQLVQRPDLLALAPTEQASVGAFGVPTQPIGTCVVSYRLGGVDAATVEADVVPAGLPEQFNLIGQDLLSQYRCLYQLADAVLILEPESPAQTHPVQVSTRGHIHLEATWKDIDTTANTVFDTGASTTVVDQRFAEVHPQLFTPDGTQTGVDATGQSRQTPMAIMRGPTIVGEKLTDALVAIIDLSAVNRTVDRPINVIAGWTLLSQANWYVDHPGRRAGCIPHPSDNQLARA